METITSRPTAVQLMRRSERSNQIQVTQLNTTVLLLGLAAGRAAMRPRSDRKSGTVSRTSTACRKYMVWYARSVRLLSALQRRSRHRRRPELHWRPEAFRAADVAIGVRNFRPGYDRCMRREYDACTDCILANGF